MRYRTVMRGWSLGPLVKNAGLRDNAAGLLSSRNQAELPRGNLKAEENAREAGKRGVRLLHMQASQQILETRLAAQAAPQRIDLEINETEGLTTITIIQPVESCRGLPQHQIGHR